MLNLIHVHVGKCGGSSVNIALHQSGISFNELHCSDSNIVLPNLIKNDSGNNIYLVTARDPIKRFVSAFNWDKYEKIIKNKVNNPHWNEIYSKFNSCNHLVESLDSSDNDIKNLAEFAIRSSFLHMHLGLSWYIPKAVMTSLPKDRTFLMRTEELLLDFNRFLKLFYPEIDKKIYLPKDKDSSGFLNEIGIENPKFLSRKSKDILKVELNDDFEVLEYLKLLNNY